MLSMVANRIRGDHPHLHGIRAPGLEPVQIGLPQPLTGTSSKRVIAHGSGPTASCRRSYPRGKEPQGADRDKQRVRTTESIGGDELSQQIEIDGPCRGEARHSGMLRC